MCICVYSVYGEGGGGWVGVASVAGTDRGEKWGEGGGLLVDGGGGGRWFPMFPIRIRMGFVFYGLS